MEQLNEEFYNISAWIIDVITIIASGIFFWTFSRLHQKNYGLYMIMILCAFDFIYPFLNITIKLLTSNEAGDTVFNALGSGDYQFALYWSTIIAIFIYIAVGQITVVNPKKYTIIAFIISFTLSLIPAILIICGAFGLRVVSTWIIEYPSTTPDKIGYFLVFDLLGRITPIVITSYCYYKVYQFLTGPSRSIQKIIAMRTTRIFWYSAIQVLCFLPGIGKDIYVLANPNVQTNAVFNFIISLLHHCWGFLNLVAYWFLRPKDDVKVSQLTQDIDDMSLTIT